MNCIRLVISIATYIGSGTTDSLKNGDSLSHAQVRVLQAIMAPLLATLPPELFQDITSLLLLPDQAALGRTCKLLNRLLTPVIWAHVELHPRGTHEGFDPMYVDDLDLEDEPEHPYKRLLLEPTSRKYAEQDLDTRLAALAITKDTLGWRHYCDRYTTPKDLFLGVKETITKERWYFLAQLVQTLCMSVQADDKMVEMIASFSNLRSLELIGRCRERFAATAPDVYLPRLESLTLRGYFSAALARKFCGNAEHITHLNLGLLATRTDDAAYDKTLLDESSTDDSGALLSDEEAERYQQNGAEAAAIASQTGNNNNGDPEADTHEKESDEESDDESDEEEEAWALHAPIWLPRNLPQRFKSLTHLHLVKPFTGETRWDWAHDRLIHIPHRYEQIVNKEWVFLLQAVAGTLKELILEHRVPMSVGDTLGDSDAVPERKRSSGDRHQPSWVSTDPDRGDVQFATSVLQLLLEKSDSFLRLRKLSFRGIQIKGLPIGSKSDELLHQRFPNCSIDIFEPAYPIHSDIYHEAVQEDGDGLLASVSFYTDYKTRFGPQWTIQN